MNWYRKSQNDDSLIKELDDYWIPVNSSFINSIAYSDRVQLLEVKLNSGKVYTYTNIPEQVFQEFLNAESKGQFFGDFTRTYKRKQNENL